MRINSGQIVNIVLKYRPTDRGSCYREENSMSTKTYQELVKQAKEEQAHKNKLSSWNLVAAKMCEELVEDFKEIEVTNTHFFHQVLEAKIRDEQLFEGTAEVRSGSPSRSAKNLALPVSVGKEGADGFRVCVVTENGCLVVYYATVHPFTHNQRELT